MHRQIWSIYKSLNIPQRRFIWLCIGLISIYITFKLLKPNINDWQHVRQFGIKIPKAFEIHGIDLSHHNGTINWEEVAQIKEDDIQLKFAFIKASEGTSISDKQFRANWRQAKKFGFDRGAYHYYIPWRDPESQVKIFTKMVSLDKNDFPPILDIEENSKRPDSRIIKEIGVWLKKIENHYGKRPIIYTNQSYYHKFVKGHFDEYPLWIADYSKKTLKHYPTETLHFWQYSKKGKLKGVDYEVDFNCYLKNESSYQALKN